jgi:hypothetical protein
MSASQWTDHTGSAYHKTSCVVMHDMYERKNRNGDLDYNKLLWVACKFFE